MSNEKDMGLLPIMSPLYNLREITKQMALLEDHLNHPRKRCPDCIRKHFLTIEALFEEAVSLDKTFEYGEYLDGKAQTMRDMQAHWLDNDGDDSYLELAQGLRAIRKDFAPICFDVRKMASTRSHICSVYKGRLFFSTKTTTEVEEEKIESLVRKNPTKKPPRKDLRKNRYEMPDQDLEGTGRGDGGDRDLSRRDHKMARNILKRWC
jgi:hypothetical protein